MLACQGLGIWDEMLCGRGPVLPVHATANQGTLICLRYWQIQHKNTSVPLSHQAMQCWVLLICSCADWHKSPDCSSPVSVYYTLAAGSRRKAHPYRVPRLVSNRVGAGVWQRKSFFSSSWCCYVFFSSAKQSRECQIPLPCSIYYLSFTAQWQI